MPVTWDPIVVEGAGEASNREAWEKTNANGAEVQAAIEDLEAAVDPLLPGRVAAAEADIDTLQTFAATKGLANGLAELDAAQLIPANRLPPITINDTFTVASQAAMLALTCQTGDTAFRTDNNKVFILAGTDPSNLSHWKEWLYPVPTVPDATASTKGILKLTGQLGGTAASPTVVGMKESGGQALSIGAITDGQRLKRSGTEIVGETVYDYVPITISNGAAAIAAGQNTWGVFKHAGTIVEWMLLADQSGSIVLDVWKDTYANFPPTVADSITASAKPTISSAIKNQSSTLTGWSPNVAAGDIWKVSVDSCSTIQKVVLLLKMQLT